MVTKLLQGKAFRVTMAQLMNCAVDYVDGEEGPTKKVVMASTPILRKSLVGQVFHRHATQSVQECVGWCPRSKLGTAMIGNRAVPGGNNRRRVVPGGTDKRWIDRRTQTGVQWEGGQ